MGTILGKKLLKEKMMSSIYHDLALQACEDYKPLRRCMLRIIDGAIEVEVSAGDIAITLERLSPVDTQEAFKELTLAFEGQGVIVAKSDAAWDEIHGMDEIVPGVLLGGEESVHIVDDLGEVVMWEFSEFEDESAIVAAIHAVALTGLNGPVCIRKILGDSLKNRGYKDD
jgi:hypothetical protein